MYLDCTLVAIDPDRDRDRDPDRDLDQETGLTGEGR